MNSLRLPIVLVGSCLAGIFLPAARAATATLLNLDFNTAGAGFAAYSSPLVTGSPGTGVTLVQPTLPGQPGFDSGLFPTAPTSGYLALTSNASAVNSGTFFGGWAANVTLGTINSLYTAGGFGQADLSKVAFTARIRARGMPANGAVVILELRGSGDNPNVPVSGYKRIRFEPVFLAGNDWTTVGGTLDTAGLTAAKGSTYAFPANAAQYTALVELNGFNQFGGSGYVAYNTPTGTSNGGRKNPGFGFTGGIRVEVDDVRLVVTDPATTGYLAPTTPAQLLRNGNFNTGDANWTFFEGAYASTDGWSEDASIFALIPGFGGSPYAGFMQNGIVINPADGEFFTATFRARFETNYQADRTIVAFMDGSAVTTFLEVDISDEIAPRLGQWHTYRASFRATPAQLAAMNGAMSLKIQPLGRTANSTPFSSALIDDVVLSQATAASVGPQISLQLAGASRADGETATLLSPVIGHTTPYTVRLVNEGGQDLVVSSVAVGGSDFVLGDLVTPFTLVPGASRSVAVSTSPTAVGALAGALTVVSNDKETADQSFVVNLAATAITLSDDFAADLTLAQRGWFTYASTSNLAGASTTTQSGGALLLTVDSSNDDYPWTYIASKPFASPGPIDLAHSALTVSLRAQGAFSGLTSNKVQLRLESLNAAGAVTGSLALGAAVDESTTGAAPGSPAYFIPDGTPDRVAVVLPEGGGYTTVGGNLSSAVNADFDVNAPAFRLVVQMTDFDFDVDAGNIVAVDSIQVTLSARGFTVANGGFESDATDPGSATPPASWLQFPVEGVSKNVVASGDPIYNATLQAADPVLVFAPYAGARALKVYGQNYYVGGVWQGPSQTGVVYQEFPAGPATSLVPGIFLHARAVAKIHTIDPLTGGAAFRFGFKYLDAANAELGRDVVTLNASAARDRWLPLVVNGTVPTGAVAVQLVSEFVQNAATDGGSVYLDDTSVGFGYVAPAVTIGGTDYPLAWSDEFDGDTLSSSNWTPEFGNGVNGWGNNEVQSYTDAPENLRVENGVLVIEARKVADAWTSARIKTQGKRSFLHGKIEFRAKLPSGVGPWPAAWMMGENFSSVGWPQCGEIDVLEWSGTRPSVVGHATHGPSRFGGNAISTTAPITNPATEFHTYAVLWEPGRVTFSVDGITTGTWSTNDTGQPFEKEFFLLLNLAVGGSYVDNQISPSLSSARFEIDYVRVYQAPVEEPLSAYQQYLAGQGLATDVAFDADADGDGVAEGVRYAFGGSAPGLGGGPAALVRAGSTLTYTFDIRADPALVVSSQTSTDLVTWSPASESGLADGVGAPEGFVRKVLTVAAGAAPRVFVRLVVHD